MSAKFVNLNWVLTALAVLGILSGIYMLVLDRRPVPVSQPVIPPAVSPFKSFISGAGIVEAASDNIQLGTMVSAVVDKVLVDQGERVPKGEALFTLDSRQAEADLKTKQASLETSKTALEQAKASLKAAQNQLDLINKVTDKRGITKEELITRQDNVLVAQTGVDNAKASVIDAQTQLRASEVTLAFYTVKAPIDCEIMQVNVHPGEYASTGVLTTPLMLIGDARRYHVRVDIDENDAWRFDKKEPAVAFLRGNAQYHTNLKFEYFEPYVIPKRSLTGDATERVDTRVLQAVYSYDPKAMPSYLGQELDIYIRAHKLAPDARYGGPLTVSK
jgi:HlyD family secretion protein